MPVFNWQLTRNKSRFKIMPILKNFQEVVSLLLVKWHHAVIIEDQ